MNIIPKPSKEIIKDGFFKFDDKILLKSDFENVSDIFDRFIPFANVNNKVAKQTIEVLKSSNIPTEGYYLEVKDNEIVIKASEVKGVFYAVQTLRQVSGLPAGKNNKFNCFIIEDSPRFKHRGFMLDEARHFFGKDFVKKQLDMLALMKLNIFHWHLTDDQGWRIEIKKYPLLTEKGTTRKSTQLNITGYDDNNEKHDSVPYGKGLFYTQEDIKEIVAYAKDLFIDVIPEIDMPGHLTAAAACYPELTCTKEQLEVSDRWGIMETIGCAGSDALYKFVFDVIDEVAPLFPYKYFHIGGDEVPKKRWEKCPACQKKIKELGLKNEEELQGAFNERVQEHLKEKGKRIIGWNEILKAGNINPETIVQWWVDDCKTTGVEKWLKDGNNIIITPCAFVYMDQFYSRVDMKKFYSMDFDTLDLPEEYADDVIGVESPMWTEYARSIEKFNFNVYPRLQAIAEIGWTAKELRNFDDFNTRIKAFDDIYKAFNIVPAPECVYICEGEDGKKRLDNIDKKWQDNPNMEFEEFISK